MLRSRESESEILERLESGVGVGYFTFDSATLLPSMQFLKVFFIHFIRNLLYFGL